MVLSDKGEASSFPQKPPLANHLAAKTFPCKPPTLLHKYAELAKVAREHFQNVALLIVRRTNSVSSEVVFSHPHKLSNFSDTTPMCACTGLLSLVRPDYCL